MIEREVIEQAVVFHGHMCPGLAMGLRVAELALAEFGRHAPDNELVALVETDMCPVDAIQLLTGCTFGRGNLIHLDYGKSAFTFMRQADGKALRITVRLIRPRPLKQPSSRCILCWLTASVTWPAWNRCRIGWPRLDSKVLRWWNSLPGLAHLCVSPISDYQCEQPHDRGLPNRHRTMFSGRRVERFGQLGHP